MFLPFSWGQRKRNAAPHAAQTKPEGMLLSLFLKASPTFLQLFQQGFALGLYYTDLELWNIVDKYLFVAMKYGCLADFYVA